MSDCILRTVPCRPTRQRSVGGGRKSALHPPAQKLLFSSSISRRTLASPHGELFALSQPAVNYWIHRLLPSYERLLMNSMSSPSGIPSALPRADGRLRRRRAHHRCNERRRQRPKNPEKQTLHYSGKQKDAQRQERGHRHGAWQHLGFLSQPTPGRRTKKDCRYRSHCLPPGTVLYEDSGFQGYEPAGRKPAGRKKSHPRGITAAEKRTNRNWLASGSKWSMHSQGETLPHRERCIRNTTEGDSDSVMEAAWVCTTFEFRNARGDGKLTNSLFLIMSSLRVFVLQTAFFLAHGLLSHSADAASSPISFSFTTPAR